MNGMSEWQERENQRMRDTKDHAAEAFNKYRESKWGAYDPYPVDAFTHFCAGFNAARQLTPSPPAVVVRCGKCGWRGDQSELGGEFTVGGLRYCPRCRANFNPIPVTPDKP